MWRNQACCQSISQSTVQILPLMSGIRRLAAGPLASTGRVP
jgi:hypothetical protein